METRKVVLFGELLGLGGLAITLVACAHKQPRAQFRGNGWRGYFGLPSTGLEYRGRLELRGTTTDSVLVEVTADNRTRDSVIVQVSTICRGVEPNFSVRVYGPQRGLLRKRGHPVWTLDAWRQAKSKPVSRKTINGLDEVSAGCGGVIYAIRFGANSSRSLGTRSIAMRDVLGDSLPPGRYLVSAVVEGQVTYVRETKIGEIYLGQRIR